MLESVRGGQRRAEEGRGGQSEAEEAAGRERTCMPSSENMNMQSRIKMTMLTICGTALRNVEMIA